MSVITEKPTQTTAPRPTAVGWTKRRAGVRTILGKLSGFSGFVLLAAFIALWEIAVRQGWQRELFVSRPSKVVGRLGTWFDDGTLSDNLLPTLKIAVLSFLMAAGMALVVALAVSTFQWLDDVFGWMLTLVYAIPKPALMPMFVIMFGLKDTPKYVLAVLLLFFMFYYNFRAALDQQSEEYRNAIRMLGANRGELLVNLTLPTLVPYGIAASRIAAPVAVLAVTFAEFFAQGNGMGRIIQKAQSNLDSTNLIAAIVVLTIVGSLVDFLFRLASRRVGRWTLGGSR